jgi:ribosomal protein S9
VNQTISDFLATERIAELMRASSDIRRGPEGGGIASQLSAVLNAPARWLIARRPAASAAASVTPKRLAEHP